MLYNMVCMRSRVKLHPLFFVSFALMGAGALLRLLAPNKYETVCLVANMTGVITFLIAMIVQIVAGENKKPR